MSEARCSVVLAVRNEQTHLLEALDSVLQQDGVDLQVVVVDDNSTDSTPALANSIAAGRDDILFLRNQSAGKASAFNAGVGKATGDFVCLFAGDDIMPMSSLRQRVSQFAETVPTVPTVSMAKILTKSEDPRFDGILVPKKLGVGNPSGASIMMNRAAVDLIFPVPESLPSEDSWMSTVIRFHPRFHAMHTDVVACEWRVHEGNTSGTFTEDFATYSRKMGDRNEALFLFRDRHHAQLSPDVLDQLDAAIRCEEMRRKRSVVGVLTSEVPLKQRLRALSSTNAFFYRIRQGLYSTLSGRG